MSAWSMWSFFIGCFTIEKLFIFIYVVEFLKNWDKRLILGNSLKQRISLNYSSSLYHKFKNFVFFFIFLHCIFVSFEEFLCDKRGYRRKCLSVKWTGGTQIMINRRKNASKIGYFAARIFQRNITAVNGLLPEPMIND